MTSSRRMAVLGSLPMCAAFTASSSTLLLLNNTCVNGGEKIKLETWLIFSSTGANRLVNVIKLLFNLQCLLYCRSALTPSFSLQEFSP